MKRIQTSTMLITFTFCTCLRKVDCIQITREDGRSYMAVKLQLHLYPCVVKSSSR